MTKKQLQLDYNQLEKDIETMLQDLSDYQDEVNKLKKALNLIQSKTGAIVTATDGVNIEEIWTIATKALKGSE